MKQQSNMHTPLTRRRRPLALTALALVSALVIAVSQSAEVRAADGTITGTVYRDFNSNGLRDLSLQLGRAVDSGIAGIQVRGIDVTGSVVGTTTTSADGSYALTVTGAASEDLRVEFDIPSGDPLLADLEPSFAASTGAKNSSRSSLVQFAEIGDTGVDLALNVPGDYCADNPQLVTCAAHLGTGTSSSVGAFTFSGAMNGFTDFTATSTLIGSSEKLGAIFGIGTDRQRNVYLGTYVKRHAEYGFAGPTNTIYRINLDQPGTVSAFITLPGSLPTHSATAVIAGVPYSGDTEVFEHVGRVGLGDVDVTPDGSTLLAVDMDQSAPKLYFVPIVGSGPAVTAGQPSSIAIPKPNSFNDVACSGFWHPMGIGMRGSRILVGGICGAEDTTTSAQPLGPNPTSTSAFVLEYSGNLSGAGTFTTIWAERLSYERGCVYTDNTIPCAHNTSDVGTPASADWSAWTEYPRFFNRENQTNYLVSGAQPMLANIEILDGGGLLIGLRDRLWDQHMNGMAAFSHDFAVSHWVSGSATTPLPFGTTAGGMAGGDLLRVCATPSGLVTESNGTCPASDLPGAEYPDPSGSKEYFYDSYNTNGYNTSGNEIHPEVFVGSLAALPGFPGGWTTAYDVTGLSRQGVYAFGPNAASLSGTPRGPATGFGSQIGGLDFGNLNSFNKGNGLADLESMCDFAPVQIGDRLWFDLDGDGIQDAGEPPVVGVQVRLVDADGNEIATAITDANGEYRFSSVTATGSSLASGLASAQGWSIVIDRASDFDSGGPLSGWVLTSRESGSNTNIDSNATTTSGYPLVAVPDMSPGVNIHSLDIGFRTPPVIVPAPFIPSVSVGDRVWLDSNGNGNEDPTEPGIAGVRLTISRADGSPVFDVFGNPVTTTTTDANGNYVFANLPPGTYVVTVSPPAGFVASNVVARQGSATSRDLVTNGSSDLTLDFGFQSPRHSIAGNVWFDVDRDGTRSGTEIDLSGVEVRLTNADGSPVFDVFGNPVTTTTTDANGNYVFADLPPGSYTVIIEAPLGLISTNRGGGLLAGAIILDVTLTDGDRVTGLDVGLASAPRLPVTGFDDRPALLALWLMVFGTLIGAVRRRQPS